jgi:hypothetical protein
MTVLSYLGKGQEDDIGTCARYIVTVGCSRSYDPGNQGGEQAEEVYDM